ncbi:MAG: hypothetical protein M3441_19445 [Chloroflexota bacterium]|nr:hypothetical protein [Chloroflexota bacterium]
METPWAILLCKFNDNNSEPFTRRAYERLFTTTGAGASNMLDYFRDVSHGNLDLSGSQVFGWYTLGFTQAQYDASTRRNRDAGRTQLVTAARRAAQDAGVNLNDYFGVVVCMNQIGDLFGGPRYAVCGATTFNQTIIGQEMGHGYGLDHSKADGIAEEYQDRWDVMSAANTYHASHTEFTNIGPILNAWNMRGRNWLDETRVWRGDPAGVDMQIELRPLVRRDLPGWLAAELPGGYLVEFRTQAGWDQAIPRPAVLVHRFEGNHSYIMKSVSDQWDLVQGDAFQVGDPARHQEAYVRAEVVTIDAAGSRATVRIQQRPAMLSDLGVFYRTGGDWLAWRAYSGGTWHGEEVFNEHHPQVTRMGGGPDILGGTEAAPAAIAGWNGNHLAVFFRGQDNRLHWKAHNGGEWHRNALIEGGGTLTSDPAVVRSGQTDLGVFYRTDGDWLAWRTYSGGTWHGEEVFNDRHEHRTRMRSAPAAVAYWTGHLYAVFYRGEDDRLRWKAHHGGQWHGDAPIEGGGRLTSDPVVVRLGIDDLGVFYRTEGDWLAWRAYSGGIWHGEEVFNEHHPTRTRMRSAPAVVTNWAGNRYAVFFRGEDDRLYWKAHSGGDWHSPALIAGGGRLNSRPGVVAFATV